MPAFTHPWLQFRRLKQLNTTNLHERQQVKGWHAPELLAVLEIDIDQLAALVHLRDYAKLPACGAGERAIVRSEAHVAGFLQGCRLWRLRP